MRVDIEEIRGPTRNQLYGRREKKEEKEMGLKEERKKQDEGQEMDGGVWEREHDEDEKDGKEEKGEGEEEKEVKKK